MSLILIVFVLYYVIAGVWLAAVPQSAIWMLQRALKWKPSVWCSIALLFALVLGVSAQSASRPVVFYIFAVLALFKGVYYLILPVEKTRAQMQWWMERPLRFYRYWGILALLCGCLGAWAL